MTTTCNLIKCWNWDKSEIFNGFKIIETIRQHSSKPDILQVNNKPVYMNLITYVVNCYYEYHLAKLFNLTNISDYYYIHDGRNIPQIDTVEGVEIKTTRWSWQDTIKYYIDNPVALHNATKVLIYNYDNDSALYYDFETNYNYVVNKCNIMLSIENYKRMCKIYKDLYTEYKTWALTL